MTQRERSNQARRKWQRMVFEQGRSGQSVVAFCRERKLCVSHFFWWKKRLRASASAKFLEMKLAVVAPASRASGWRSSRGTYAEGLTGWQSECAR